METMSSRVCKYMLRGRVFKHILLLMATATASTAFAQTAAWGGAALCLIAGNTKATIGIAAVVGIMIGGVMALFKKGDHLLDTVVSVCIVCGVAFLAVTIITQMGFTVSCAGL